MNLSVRLYVECTVLEVACFVIVLMLFTFSYKNCGDQYVGSATDFKSNIKTRKDKCGISRHFNSKSGDSNNPHISPNTVNRICQK